MRSHGHFQIVKPTDVDRLAGLETGDGRSRSKVRRGQIVEPLVGQDCSVGTSAWGWVVSFLKAFSVCISHGTGDG